MVNSQKRITVVEWLTNRIEENEEEDSRYRNNKYDSNCEGGNDSFVTVALFMF